MSIRVETAKEIGGVARRADADRLILNRHNLMKSEPQETWTIAEAKARLSEILRLAREEGPQRIGTDPSYVVVAEEWLRRAEPRIPLGRWLVENMPRIGDLELPDRHEPERPSPFEDWEFDENPGGK